MRIRLSGRKILSGRRFRARSSSTPVSQADPFCLEAYAMIRAALETQPGVSREGDDMLQKVTQGMCDRAEPMQNVAGRYLRGSNIACNGRREGSTRQRWRRCRRRDGSTDENGREDPSREGVRIESRIGNSLWGRGRHGKSGGDSWWRRGRTKKMRSISWARRGPETIHRSLRSLA